MRLERGEYAAETLDDGRVAVSDAAVAIVLDPGDARWLMLLALPTLLAPLPERTPRNEAHRDA